MKKDIHPNYNETSVKCACGNSFKTGSTLSEINIEVCSECHPFYTGKEKVVDTAGRVEKFNKKRSLAKPKKAKKERTKPEKSEKKDIKPIKK